MSRASLFASILSAALLTTAGCGGAREEEPTVCAPEGVACFECAGYPTRCEYDGVEVTIRSCQDCQARVALYEELCADGVEMSLAEIDPEIVCEVVEEPTEGT